MTPKLLFAVAISIIVTCPLIGNAQTDSTIQKAGSLVDRFSLRMLKATHAKYASIEKDLAKQNDKYLARMQRREEKLARKLSGKDSIAARQLFSRAKEKYDRIRSQVSKPAGNTASQFLPGLDSIHTLFGFIDKSNARLPGLSPAKLKEIREISAQLSALKQNLQHAADIKSFLKERKQFLTEKLTALGWGRSLNQVNKEVYYYQAQVNEYKSLLNDPDKLQQRVLSFARNTPVFKDLMARNSQLAQLFGIPGGSTGSSGPSLAGLQTVTGVQQNMSVGLGGSAGIDPGAMVQQQAQAAQAQLNSLKDKINKLGGSSSEMVIPEFKPNNQKTKSFWKRIEYGLNIQSQKPNALLPTTTDLALTAGYKLNDKSTIGIGASYKIGWGKDISHIHITNQGLSLRSYLDVKLKGSWWISGGYEYNYQHEFTKIDQLKDMNAWQKSGLLGLTKKYKIGKKNGNLQLLWDLLSYDQVPRTQPLKFRLGYTL